MTPTQLADELDLAPMTVRQYLRDRFPRDASVKGTPWELTPQQVRAVRRRWWYRPGMTALEAGHRR